LPDAGVVEDEKLHFERRRRDDYKAADTFLATQYFFNVRKSP